MLYAWIATPGLADLTDEGLLGNVRLLSVLASSNTSIRSDISGSSYISTLAGWDPLPSWPEHAPVHNLRDASTGAQSSNPLEYSNGHPTSFRSAESRRNTKVMTAQSVATTSRGSRDKIVLVPTDAEKSVYTRPEPQSRGLQEFLESDGEDGEAVPDNGNEESSEESSEEEEDDQKDQSGDDEEEDSASSEGDSEGADRHMLLRTGSGDIT